MMGNIFFKDVSYVICQVFFTASPEVQLSQSLEDRLRARSTTRLQRQAAAGKPGAFLFVTLEDVFRGEIW